MNFRLFRGNISASGEMNGDTLFAQPDYTVVKASAVCDHRKLCIYECGLVRRDTSGANKTKLGTQG